jgi:hypothetical protein
MASSALRELSEYFDTFGLVAIDRQIDGDPVESHPNGFFALSLRKRAIVHLATTLEALEAPEQKKSEVLHFTESLEPESVEAPCELDELPDLRFTTRSLQVR